LALNILEKHDQTKKLWFECLGNFIFLLITQKRESEARKSLEIFSSNLFSIHENSFEILLLKDFLFACFEVNFGNGEVGTSNLIKVAETTSDLLLIEKIKQFISQFGKKKSKSSSKDLGNELPRDLNQHQLNQIFSYFDREPTEDEKEAVDLMISRGFNPNINKRLQFVKDVTGQTVREMEELEEQIFDSFNNQYEEYEESIRNQKVGKKKLREFGFLKKNPFDDL
jgi:hypothetical protein